MSYFALATVHRTALRHVVGAEEFDDIEPSSVVASVVGGVVGAVVWGSHPWLGAVNGAAAARCLLGWHRGEVTVGEAARGASGRTLATIGALAAPSSTLLGVASYAAGALVAGVVAGVVGGEA